MKNLQGLHLMAHKQLQASPSSCDVQPQICLLMGCGFFPPSITDILSLSVIFRKLGRTVGTLLKKIPVSRERV